MTTKNDDNGAHGGLIEQFRHQVERCPTAAAVVDATDSWCYEDLDRISDGVAETLLARGIGSGALVAVVMRNSSNLVAMLLGILKSGAGYVPLSSDDPAERIRGIIVNSQASVVIVDDETLLGQSNPTTPTVLSSELLHGGSHYAQPDFDPYPGPNLNDTAYVIYTSGSTGVPKGVAIDHAALAAYLHVASSEYPALAGRALLHSSVSYDMSVTSLFGPLVSGGTIMVGNLMDIAREGLPPHLRKPTFLKVTPSHLPLLQTLPPEVSPSEALVIGGESLPQKTLRAWWKWHPGVAVANEYGPTEATVGCCVYWVRPEDPRDGVVPIGKATDGTQLYVLDENGLAVADGEQGELYIAGAQVAQGYLHNDEATSRQFLPDPFAEGNSTMYRTGDRVRQLASGELEFLGRKDRQVKIDGHRVEPGDVESALLSVESIAQAAVVATNTQAGSNRLSAFVRPARGVACDLAVLRKELETTLPPHMVPSHISAVGEFPLTPNGKLDLDELFAEENEAKAPVVQPDSEEDLLCRLISEVTGARSVGIDDDFMELGGSSVSAAQFVGLARKAGVDFALTDVLRHRTVRRMLEQARPMVRPSEEGTQ